MTGKSAKVRPVPEGYRTVTPWISVKGAAQLIDFMKEAFGAEETGRVYNQDGSIGHAEVRIGDSVVMLFDAAESWPVIPCLLRLYVDDGDAVYRQALKAGATSVTPMTFLFYGDRVGRVRDPFGNIWWIQTHVEDVAPDIMMSRAQEQPYREAMQQVQESLNRELSSRGSK